MNLSPLLKLLHSGYVWDSEAVHGYACKIGLDGDEFVSGGLVKIYLKFGMVKEGRVFCLSLMLKAYLYMGFKEEEVEQVSIAFHRSGLYPNETTFRYSHAHLLRRCKPGPEGRGSCLLCELQFSL
ncbi:unnamed protein product [Eruca vesicaria subsp. sativa]|uniref:Pentatricopeptide repeat-containing protein n=1 Tax=Eruca vesicaria subsp. sativa TaxID=29727 RepID=A0ABC8JLR2_ERUVS|nr:unnamed protein product [Eruca vesicaria subsp. sativa]